MAASDRLRFRIRKADFEVELEGEKDYVKNQYEKLLDELKTLPTTSSEASSKDAPSLPLTLPKTLKEKFEHLKAAKFFSEPRDSGTVTKELRDKGWGIYASKDISSALKRVAPEIGLRRVSTGKDRYAYTYP